MSSPRQVAFAVQPENGCDHCGRAFATNTSGPGSSKCGHTLCERCIDRSCAQSPEMCLSEDCGQRLRKNDVAEQAVERTDAGDGVGHAVYPESNSDGIATARNTEATSHQGAATPGQTEDEAYLQSEKMKTPEQKWKERVAPTGEVWYRDHPNYFPLVDHPLILKWWAIQADYEDAVKAEMRERRTWWVRAKGALGYNEKEPEKLTEEEMEKLGEALFAEEDNEVDDDIDFPELTSEQKLRLEVEKDLEEHWVDQLKDERFPPLKISSQQLDEILELEKALPSLGDAIAQLARERPLIPPEYQVVEWASDYEPDESDLEAGTDDDDEDLDDDDGDDHHRNEARPSSDAESPSVGRDAQLISSSPSSGTRSSSTSDNDHRQNDRLEGRDSNQGGQPGEDFDRGSQGNCDERDERPNKPGHEDTALTAEIDNDGPLELELHSMYDDFQADDQEREDVQTNEADGVEDDVDMPNFDNDGPLMLELQSGSENSEADGLQQDSQHLDKKVDQRRQKETAQYDFYEPNLSLLDHESTPSPNIWDQFVPEKRLTSPMSRSSRRGPPDDCPNWRSDGPLFHSVDGWFWHHREGRWVYGAPPPQSPRSFVKKSPRSSKNDEFSVTKPKSLSKSSAHQDSVDHPVVTIKAVSSMAGISSPNFPKHSIIPHGSKRNQSYRRVYEVDPGSPQSTIGSSIGKRVHNRQTSLHTRRAAGNHANKEIERHYTPKRRRTVRFDVSI